MRCHRPGGEPFSLSLFPRRYCMGLNTKMHGQSEVIRSLKNKQCAGKRSHARSVSQPTVKSPPNLALAQMADKLISLPPCQQELDLTASRVNHRVKFPRTNPSQVLSLRVALPIHETCLHNFVHHLSIYLSWYVPVSLTGD